MFITVSNRQRAARVNLAALREFASEALAVCLNLRTRKSPGLRGLDEISVVLVSDKRIADLHRRFLNQNGTTDVITFQHGEIFISPETAKRQARQFGTSLGHEIRLYLVHGLLHLCGFEDKTPAGAAAMKRVQERLVAQVDRALRRSMP